MPLNAEPQEHPSCVRVVTEAEAVVAESWAKQEHPDDSDAAEWREEERAERQEREWEAADRRDSTPGYDALTGAAK